MLGNRRMDRPKPRVLVSAIVVSAVFVAAWVLATVSSARADGGDASQIHACVGNNGAVRIVSATSSCRKNETPVHWSVGGSGAGSPLSCPPDSMPVGATCIDKYESSLWQTSDAPLIAFIRAGTVTHADLVASGAVALGLAPGDLEAAGCLATGNDCTNVFAVSIPNVMPARFVTWFQALAVTRNAGKRLPSYAEWQAAAQGTPSGLGGCQTSTGTPSATGSAPSCVSNAGTFDMVGNVAEWSTHVVFTGVNCGDWGISTDAQCFRGISFVVPPGAFVLGGHFDDGAVAGPMALDARTPITSSSPTIGVRGVR